MYRSRARLRLGMAHTQAGGIAERALLAEVGDLRWQDLGTLTGVPPAAQRNEDGQAVYASFYYAELSGFPPEGLAAFGPDDELELVGSVARHGRNMLDGSHSLYRVGVLPEPAPEPLPPAPAVRLSNVFVREGAGPDDLRITAPTAVERIPPTDVEPDSYALIREARRRGRFWEPPAGATALWPGWHTVPYPIDADRDVNGVGLVYFANYVAFTDRAERTALETRGGLAPEALDGRRTLRRRIGYYGNARRHEVLQVDVEAWRLPGDPPRLLLHHRLRRGTDDRLIAVSSVEKALVA